MDLLHHLNLLLDRWEKRSKKFDEELSKTLSEGRYQRQMEKYEAELSALEEEVAKIVRQEKPGKPLLDRIKKLGITLPIETKPTAKKDDTKSLKRG